MADPDDDAPAAAGPPLARRRDASPIAAASDDDLPVVARLVVEVRSDGRRTIARGAVEDTASGQRVAIDARGDSPVALALQLARALFRGPALAARLGVRGLLGRGRRDG
jgi:hypothetical protein